MRCEEVMDLIQRNLDDDLSSSESANMHEHLRSCLECQSLHESLSQLSFELENLPDIEPPVSIVDRILPQLEISNQADSISVAGMRQPRIQHGPFLWKRWALAAGSAAAVLLIWISVDRWSTPELDQSKEQMQSAADTTSKSAKVTDPSLQGSAQPEVAMNHSLDVEPVQETENQVLPADDRKQPAPIENAEKQTSPTPNKEVREKQEDHTLALGPSPDQHMALAPQEKAAAEEPMPSIAAIQPPAEEEDTPVALAPQEPTDMIHTMMSSELSDTSEAASRGGDAYPSPGGEWMANVDGQTLVIIDQSGMEVFRSHAWPSEREVKVEWLDQHLLQYTLLPQTTEENASMTAEEETWRINIQDRQEQKQ